MDRHPDRQPVSTETRHEPEVGCCGGLENKGAMGISKGDPVGRIARQGEGRFRLLIENITDVIWTADSDLRLTYVSPAVVRQRGYTVNEVMSQTLEEMMTPSSIETIKRVVAEELASHSAQGGGTTLRTIEVEQRCKEGSTMWAEINATFIRNKEGKVVEILGVTRDITQRKMAELERAKHKSQLQQTQRLEAIGQLAAGIAHEINTPTQYVGDNIHFLKEAFGGICHLLHKQEELLEAAKAHGDLANPIQEIENLCKDIDVEFLSAEIPKAIEQTLDGIERISTIVSAMKDFSHAGSDEKSPVDLNRCIQSTITVSRNEWKYVADVVMDLDPRLPTVPGHQAELNQAILNLIVNAAHAIGDVVGDGSHGKGKITVTTRKDSDWVEVRVADTGPGIPESIRSRIFEPFFTTKEVGRGTGQGLAISRSAIVDRHGGTITFETETGKGTTFTVRLPLRQTSPDQEEDHEETNSIR